MEGRKECWSTPPEGSVVGMGTTGEKTGGKGKGGSTSDSLWGTPCSGISSAETAVVSSGGKSVNFSPSSPCGKAKEANSSTSSAEIGWCCNQ